MGFEQFKTALIGDWNGTKQLYLSPPPDPAQSSRSKLSIVPAAGGSFLELNYSWTYEEEEQTGVLLFGYDEKNSASAAWVDSFHMSARIMFCTGTAAAAVVNLRGSYEVPPGPDWGWSIGIHCASASQLQIVMHNISPEGQVDLAVQMDYTRSA